MFIGHYGVALAAKKAAPKVSLGWLVAATSFIDLIWPPFLLLGLEHVRIAPGITPITPFDFYDYPWSHSLLMAAVWSVMLGGCFWLLRRDAKSAAIIALVAVSHWFLDLVVHIPDLPLYPGGPKAGMGLWNSVAATLAIELTLLFGGLAIYLSATRGASARGRWGIPVFAAFLLLFYIASLAGPPPPSVEMLGWFGLLPLLFVPLCAWLDKARAPR